MKTWILATVMMFGLAVNAQHRGDKQDRLKPEQRAELRAKEMTLALNLNDKQQKDVKALLLDRSKKAEATMAQHKAAKASGKKLTADERFAMRSRMLDEKIAMKAEMKKILTAEQFSKWEMKAENREKVKDRRHKEFRKGRK